MRSCLGSVPWAVRPDTRSKARRGGPAATPKDCEFPTGTHQANKVNVVAKKRPERTQPPRNFTHLVLRENPQLAAPVAVQFQNSEARLPQSHLEQMGELFSEHSIPRPTGRRIAAGDPCPLEPPRSSVRRRRPLHRPTFFLDVRIFRTESTSLVGSSMNTI